MYYFVIQNRRGGTGGSVNHEPEESSLKHLSYNKLFMETDGFKLCAPKTVPPKVRERGSIVPEGLPTLARPWRNYSITIKAGRRADSYQVVPAFEGWYGESNVDLTRRYKVPGCNPISAYPVAG